MKNYNKYLVIGLGLFQMISAPAQASWDFFKPAKLEERIRKEVAKQEIGASLKILDLELFEGLGIAVKYKAESEPSYVDGYYTRIDKYSINADLRPGDLIDGLDMPIGFDISRGTEVIFARQFKSQRDSLVAVPYFMKHIPLTAERAIRNLNPGDFVGLQANLNFVLSLNGSSIQNGFELGASTHAFVSGKFLVHLFRMPNNKIRVKLISLNSKGAGADAEVKYGLDLDIIGFNYLENKIDKIVDLSPIQLGLGNSKNNLFMLDYVFDLNNPQAAQAYDDMMSRKVQFKDLDASNPFRSVDKMAERVLTDLSAVEEISEQDHGQLPSQRRINRLFKGTNRSTNSHSGIKLGINLLKFQSGTASAVSHVTSFDRTNVAQKYILETTSNRTKTKALFGLWGTEEVNTSSLLFTADDSFKATRFVAFSNDKVRKEKELDKGDLKDIKLELARLIPASEYNKIDWSPYNFRDGDYINSAYRITTFFHPDAVAALPRMAPSAYTDLFKKYVNRTGGFNGGVKNEPPQWDPEARNGFKNYEEDYKEIGKELFNSTNPLLDTNIRLNSFTNLKKIPVWQTKGLGFLISLLPQDNIGRLVSFEFSLSSKNGPTITHRFGRFEQEALYESLMYTQNVISNQGFDLRLWTDENGEYTVRQQ